MARLLSYAKADRLISALTFAKPHPRDRPFRQRAGFCLLLSPGQRFSALAIPMATEPPYVFSAAKRGGHLTRETTSAHATACRLRQALESGTKPKPAHRRSWSLDTRRPHTCSAQAVSSRPGCGGTTEPSWHSHLAAGSMPLFVMTVGAGARQCSRFVTRQASTWLVREPLALQNFPG